MVPPYLIANTLSTVLQRPVRLYVEITYSGGVFTSDGGGKFGRISTGPAVSGSCLKKKFSFKQMSHVIRKPDRICENKDADQLRSNWAADQRLCFRYTDSTIPLLPKSEISRL